jgi:beta-glucosidase
VHVAGALEDSADRDTVAGADVVIAVVGYTDDHEGEAQIAAGDRKSLELPEEDRLVLAEASSLNERVVAVVVGGGAFTTDGWGDAVEALVMSWYSGARGGDALADVICGDRNFSGRLPITFARQESDYPPFDNESLEVQYGYFHGYRLLQREETEPLYPFGYGLGYTSFSFDSVEVRRVGDEIVIEVDVTNTGDRSGVETVQVYVAHPRAEDERAPRDLRAFTQVDLDPGETATATARFAVDELAVWNDTLASWELVPGTYRVEVGPNVETLPLTAEVTLP